MFTGLVAMQGRVVELKPEDQGCRLTIAASLFDNTIELGESIAINGVCLTVVQNSVTKKPAFNSPLRHSSEAILVRWSQARRLTLNVPFDSVIASVVTGCKGTLME
jgi:riboflavin synthase alpha subunit